MTIDASSAIFALSSAPGRAAIAVIRVSGANLISRMAGLGLAKLRPRQAGLRTLTHPETNAVLDQAVAIWFASPSSQTGEDVVELHVHGGRAVIASVLEALGILPGFRMAEPGEFARRAFDNGKLDLTAAEGLADLIDAETELQRKQALAQASGQLANRYDAWRSRLIEAMALMEAAIDFSDEGDVSASAVALSHDRVVSLLAELDAHLAAAHRGEIVRDGFKVAIAGAPNAGKSSLLNALAQRDVAIVSEVPGTTRDVIEVALDLDGIRVVMWDTAGVRETGDAVEREGIRRTEARMAEADLVIWLSDPAHPMPCPAELKQRHIVRVSTKADQAGKLSGTDLCISARTGVGLTELIRLIATAARDRIGDTDALPPTNVRHRLLLTESLKALQRALDHDDATAELAAEELRQAAAALGRLTGAVDAEDVLGQIFGRFCIGK